MIGWLRRRIEQRVDRQAALSLTALEDGAAHYVVNDLDKKTGINAGSMYPALARLEHGGHIESGWAEPGPRGHRRRWYRAAIPPEVQP